MALGTHGRFIDNYGPRTRVQVSTPWDLGLCRVPCVGHSVDVAFNTVELT